MQSSDDDEEMDDAGDVSDESSDDDAAPPSHWMDVLTDILLALLSAPANSTLPTAPVREAAEALFG